MGVINKWAAFTWLTDTHRAFRVLPHVLLNWVCLAALVYGWWHWWDSQWKALAIATLVGLLYTIGRAARWLPRTASTIRGLYAATAKPCGHPNITRTQPIDPRTRVKVSRWVSPTVPHSGAIAYEASSPTGTPSTRWMGEKAIETAIAKEDTEIVFDHDSKPGWVKFTRVSPTDPRVAQKKTRRWIESVIAQIVPTTRTSDGLDVAIQWATTPTPSEGDDQPQARPDVPEQITVDYGAVDMNGRATRDQAETRFDQSVDRGVEWLHDWSAPGQWLITATERDSADAVRKRTARKVSSVSVSAVHRFGKAQAAKQTEVEVTRWAPDTASAAVLNTPVEIMLHLGTADFSNLADQHALENTLDTALENEWPDRVWLPEWQFGHAATLTLAAVPANHVHALRKKERLRLRSVAQAKIKGIKRGDTPVDVDVTDWSTGTNGQQQAAKLTVSFGTADVTDPETRERFTDHFDSLTDENDWRYEWESAAGKVHITAVAPLPETIPFPAEGTPEAHRWHDLFRDGKILLGPAKGGYEAVIDLDKSPHTLVGGSTGAGKSVLLTSILYGALMNPNEVELIVVDPKVTDFTWTPGYPNVRMYAVRDVRTLHEEINAVTRYAVKAMAARQAVLRQYGVENLGELRRGIRNGTITGITLDEVPKRLILFFDEGGAAFTPSKDPDVKDAQDASRTDMENLGMLGRAMEVNIVMAAQKPSEKNIGTAIRAQMTNRVAVGSLGPNESRQVLDNTLASKGLDGAPKGRGWYVNDSGRELLFQSYYLPKRDTPNPTDSRETIAGVQERVADQLTDLGWTPVDTVEDFTRTDEDSDRVVEVQVRTTKWVRLDRVDVDIDDETSESEDPDAS